MARPKTYIVHLSDAEVQTLRSLLRKKDTTQTICNRCRILLDLDENHPPALTQRDCANIHGISRSTVVNTIRSYTNSGLPTLLSLKRSVNSDNARRKVDGRIEAQLIEIACGPVPQGHSRWTIRLLEKQMKLVLDEPISREAIRRTLKKTGFDLTAPNIGACQAKQTQRS